MSPSSNRRGLLYRCAAGTSPKQWAGDRWRASTTPGLFQSSLPCVEPTECSDGDFTRGLPAAWQTSFPSRWSIHWPWRIQAWLMQRTVFGTLQRRGWKEINKGKAPASPATQCYTYNRLWLIIYSNMNYRFIPVPRDTKSMFCHRQSQYATTNRIFRIIDTSFDTFFDHPPRAPYSAASIFRTFIRICQFQPAFFLKHHPHPRLFSDSPFIDRPFLKSNPTFRMWRPVGSVISVPPHPGLLRLIRDSMNNMLKIHS
jgi:hypothetical protein